MTRAEAAQMFYNLLISQNVTSTVSFRDVPANAWYAKAVHTLATLGMINGYSDGTFRPNAKITRAEFTAIAMRFSNQMLGGTNPFRDVSRTDWYYNAVVGASQYGWITGYSDGTFQPNATITRAEVTAIVNRMLERSADKWYIGVNAGSLKQFSDLNSSDWAYYDIMEAVNTHGHSNKSGAERWS